MRHKQTAASVPAQKKETKAKPISARGRRRITKKEETARKKRYEAICREAEKREQKRQMEIRWKRQERERFFDRVAPTGIRFFTDHAVVGNSYRCYWAIREYPPTTESQAILKGVATMAGVTMRIYAKQLSAVEENKLISSGSKKTIFEKNNTAANLYAAVAAEGNFDDLRAAFVQMRKDHEHLVYCAVFLELRAGSEEALSELKIRVKGEMMAAQIFADELWLRQREGMLACHPLGRNVFGLRYSRPLPVGSVANLYPMSFSGRLDPHGLKIGKDRYGSDIYLDLDRRTRDVTNGNVVILGNSGQGKSWLVKLLCTNLAEQGKEIYLLDPEEEYREWVEGIGGTYIDFMSGRYKINLLEPKRWAREGGDNPGTEDTPAAFRMPQKPLSQHISYLKDFFRIYKDFNVQELDTLEILLTDFYRKKEIYDENAFLLLPEAYPTVEEFYDYIRTIAEGTEEGDRELLYTKETLRRLLTALYSMAKGAEACYFNGKTNLPQSRILAFGVGRLLESNQYLKHAVLFTLLSYMSDKLLQEKNAVAVLDEFYLFLSSPVVVEYARNVEKRDRKADSNVILASQNIEDYTLPDIKEMTKPLLAIPCHQFLFSPGNVRREDYCDLLQVPDCEWDIIKTPERGRCLYRCGNERYILQVQAPEHKARLFGTAGGR